MAQKFRFRGTRRDRHDTDIMWRKFFAQVFRHAVHGELRANISDMIGEGLAASHRADVDDCAGLARSHASRGSMNAVEKAFDIDLQHSVPFIRVLLAHFTQQHHTGIIDDSIGRTELGFGFLDGCRKRLAVSDVDGFAERVWQLELFHRVQSARQKQQWMTAMGKHFCSGKANARACAGNNDEWKFFLIQGPLINPYLNINIVKPKEESRRVNNFRRPLLSIRNIKIRFDKERPQEKPAVCRRAVHTGDIY